MRRSVRWVVLSHLHTDHVGGIGAFPDAEVIVSRVEWERAQGMSGQLRGYVPQRWPLGEPVLVDLSGPPVGPFPGSYDVAGDGHARGRARRRATRPGTSSLDRPRRSAFLGGDIAHTPAELPAPIADFCTHEHLTVLLAHDG